MGCQLHCLPFFQKSHTLHNLSVLTYSLGDYEEKLCRSTLILHVPEIFCTVILVGISLQDLSGVYYDFAPQANLDSWGAEAGTSAATGGDSGGAPLNGRQRGDGMALGFIPALAADRVAQTQHRIHIGSRSICGKVTDTLPGDLRDIATQRAARPSVRCSAA